MQIVKNRAIFLGVSILVILVGIGCMVFNSVRKNGAFNYDVEFIGGTSMEVNIGKSFDNNDVTNIIKDVTGETAPQVQKINDGTEVAIKTKSLDIETRTELQNKLKEKFELEDDAFTVQDVSATVSKDMIRDSILSVLIACVCMLIYISIRFRDFSMGLSSILALVHDTLVVLGAYALFRIPLNNSFIAAILTVLGYSINASIVIFDRIRENRSSLGRHNYEQLVNTSVKQTLTRSLFTSLTTFFCVAALWVLGVDSVKEFVFPIAVGIIAGTYSSVLVAGNIWYMVASAIGKKKQAEAIDRYQSKKVNKSLTQEEKSEQIERAEEESKASTAAKKTKKKSKRRHQ